MPIYEYECKSCGNIFEYLSLRQKQLSFVKCPKCGALAKRKISKSNFNAVDLKCQRIFGHKA